MGAAALGFGTAGAARAEGFAALPAALARIEATRGGRLGVAVLDTGSGARAGHREAERFAMASTFKLLLSAAVLARADAGQEDLARRIHYTPSDLVSHSPVTARHVATGMAVEALCAATMVTSDNAAANLLLATLGGPAGLTAWLRAIGDGTTRLDRWETAMSEARPDDPRDTTTPAAMLASLQAVTLGEVLRAPSRALLLGWLRDNQTGDARLRAGLAPGWTAGEKTGTGGHANSGDVGLLYPPGGAPPVLVAAYVAEGAAEGRVRDAALAEVAAAVAAAWSAARG
jgi:beta-lactamase class A